MLLNVCFVFELIIDRGLRIRPVVALQLTVNSGGVVYFSMFRRGNREQADSEDEKIGEAAAVFKFGSSRLATQSERLGIEIARHLGVATPQVGGMIISLCPFIIGKIQAL